MITVDRVVIVEGKYDKIKLENIIDATIITTNGFSIFKNIEKRRLIKEMAQKKGLLVLTDSDSAGMLIRNHIKNICPDADIINVYVPKITGKEKRKEKAGAENILGVEGIPDDTLLNALKNAGVFADKATKRKETVTKQDLFLYGLSGYPNSKQKRNDLANYLGFIDNVSSNVFLDIVNTFYDKKEFESRVIKWQQEAGRK